VVVFFFIHLLVELLNITVKISFHTSLISN